MSTQRTSAIVLRRTNYGEADRILQLLTPLGKFSVIAKGVRREKSRLAGGIELFAISDIVITSGKGDLGILTSARLDDFYHHILEDYDRMQFAYEVLKQVNRASEMVNEPEWFDVLLEVLAGLDAITLDLRIVQTWFYLRYAALLGHELSVWRDVSGDELLANETYRYDEGEKGFLQSKNGDITEGHIKYLRLVSQKPLKIIAQIGGVELILPSCLAITRQHAAIY
ncbi:MAG: DNA repair protein RecO [Candidatus Saccharimonadales bacterium]